VSRPLDGFRVVVLGVNAPLIVAGARLAALGAEVVKIEPPSGDPTGHFAPGWYAQDTASQRVLRLDLKSEEGRHDADGELERADGLLTAMRPASLGRLGFDEEAVAERFPRLVHVAIVGFPAPRQNVAGHDLTYQAALGLVDPPRLPRVLVADLAGAEQAVVALLALLLARERGRPERYSEVALAAAAEDFAAPYRFGATAADGPVGGGDPLYGVYEAADGWIAVAALEPHFRGRLLAELELEDLDALAAAFRGRGKQDWQAWAEERDLPIAAVA
jgi:crotonobetainyl-CoA:carnitine CoA-transferase CaiB-like acyl-CoA transferase